MIADGSPLLSPVDWQVLGTLAFEAAAMGLAVLGLRGWRTARRLSVFAFRINFLAAIGAMTFALTFAMPRLI